MILTNKLGLPEALVSAVANDPYNAGDCDISVTRLIQPPQLRYYAKKHAAEITEDASERIWSLLGQSIHTILERATDVTQAQRENRLFTEVLGWTVSGAYDRFIGAKMQDYKVTSTYSVRDEGKQEWEWQINLLAALARRNGMVVEEGEVVAILRDWSRANAMRDSEYPQQAVLPVRIPIWTPEQAEAFLHARVALHQQAENTGNPMPCTDEERWFSGEKFAVMKKGGKRAVKLHPTREEAEAHAKNSGTGFHVEHRVGEYKRCSTYCAASEFCPQWASNKPAF